MKNAILWIVVIVLVIWGLSAVSGAKKPADTANNTVAGETIKIGILAPMTGDGAVYGEPFLNIAKIAVEEINATGGVGGKNIELVVEDAKCNGKDATNAAQKLVNANGVHAIIGGFCSSESLAAIPVAEAAGVALASPGSSSSDLTGKSKIFFRNYPSDSSQGAVIAEVLWKQGRKSVAIISEQTDYALGVVKAFTAKYESLGGKVLIKEEFPSTAKDFRSQISKIKASKPDVLLVSPQTPAAGELVLTQLKESGWKVPLAVSDVIMSTPTLITAHKATLEGAVGAEVGVDMNNPKFKKLVDTYKARYGVDVPYQSYAQTEYDMVYIIRDAIEAVGYDGLKIATWAKTIKNWSGAAGLVTIGENGDPVSGHRPETVKDGKIVPLTI